ncbi:hypothetical protein DFO58_2149 [Arthrobacter sp. AG1021]|nr:hypothetical protein [Arthrobacter sp. AG1021]RKS19648.1 hypothetical protein DFO58_2149 [Arthrobacter sp. AG1021]
MNRWAARNGLKLTKRWEHVTTAIAGVAVTSFIVLAFVLDAVIKTNLGA